MSEDKKEKKVTQAQAAPAVDAKAMIDEMVAKAKLLLMNT